MGLLLGVMCSLWCPLPLNVRVSEVGLCQGPSLQCRRPDDDEVPQKRDVHTMAPCLSRTCHETTDSRMTNDADSVVWPSGDTLITVITDYL